MKHIQQTKPTLLLFLLLSSLVAPVFPAQKNGKDDAARKALDVLREELKDDSAYTIKKVLRNYCNLERAGKFDLAGRYTIHKGLVEALKANKTPAVAEAGKSILESTTKTMYPAQVAVLKAMRSSRFPLPKKEKIALYTELAGSKTFRLSVWAIRCLGDAKWPEAVDALIAIMAKEETSGKSKTSLVWSIAGSELYRILGNLAPQGALSALIRKNWEKSKKKIPGKPDYSLGSGGGPTAVFFGDIISPRSTFLIDISTSMLQETSLKVTSSKRTATKKETSGKKEKKVAIVKRELENCVKRLRASCKFNILSYNAKVMPWYYRGSLKLQSATSGNLASAVRFAQNLQVNRGTNIHDSMKTALPIPDVETIYLLSDGAPSVGGGQKEIMATVNAMNYLRGVRVITYGFRSSNKKSFDENFMKDLSAGNWGWYRRLNN